MNKVPDSIKKKAQGLAAQIRNGGANSKVSDAVNTLTSYTNAWKKGDRAAKDKGINYTTNLKAKLSKEEIASVKAELQKAGIDPQSWYL